MKHAVRHTWLLHPSVHIATHFGQGISCSRKKSQNLGTFFYLQAAAYRIEIPPASHFGRQITKKLKAERRLTHRWIHLILVQNNLPSGVLRLVVPSHQLPIHQYVLILPKHCFAHITSCWQYYTFRNYVWLLGLSDT